MKFINSGSLSLPSENRATHCDRTCDSAKFPVINARLCNTKVKFVVDSGACATFINQPTYAKIGYPRLIQTNKRISTTSTATEKSVALLGKFQVIITNRDVAKMRMTVYVIDEKINSWCVLSKSVSLKLGLIRLLPSITNSWNLLNFIRYANHPVADVRLNNTKVKFVVDSGTTTTLINRSIYAKIGSPALAKANSVVIAFMMNEPVPLLGEFEVTLERDNNRVRTIVYVDDDDKSMCVLSISDSEMLGLLKLHPGLTRECAHVLFDGV